MKVFLNKIILKSGIYISYFTIWKELDIKLIYRPIKVIQLELVLPDKSNMMKCLHSYLYIIYEFIEQI